MMSNHWVDPTGKPEQELAEQYRQKAEDIENAGYQTLITNDGLAVTTAHYWVRNSRNLMFAKQSVLSKNINGMMRTMNSYPE